MKLSVSRPFALACSMLVFLWSVGASAAGPTFDEKRMRSRLADAPDASSYFDSSSFPPFSQDHLSLELRKKSKHLVEAINKKIKLKRSVHRSEMDAVVSFIENLKPTLPLHFENNSSIYIHADSILPYSVMAYKSGRIYILFDAKDARTISGGFKQFTRSMEYVSEKPHAHLVLKKKSKSTKLSSSIAELKVQMAFLGSSRVLSFLDTDVYTYKSSVDGTYKSAIAIEEDLYEGDLSSMVKTCPNMSKAIEIFLEMAKAVDEMHTAKYVHRDIKPDNFFHRKTAGKTEVVLADFGLTESKRSKNLGQWLCGTPGFIDPDGCLKGTLSGMAFETFEEGKKADIFALGMSFMDIIHGSAHHLHTQTREVNDLIFDRKKVLDEKTLREAVARFKSLHEATFPEGVSLLDEKEILFKVHIIVAKMISPESSKRVDIREVIEHLDSLKTGTHRHKLSGFFERIDFSNLDFKSPKRV